MSEDLANPTTAPPPPGLDLVASTLGGQEAFVLPVTKLRVSTRKFTGFAYRVRDELLAPDPDGVISNRFIVWFTDHLAIVREWTPGPAFTVYAASGTAVELGNPDSRSPKHGAAG